MKTNHIRLSRPGLQIAIITVWAAFASVASANTFTVGNSGASAYVINGANNPTLTLYRGRSYIFNINAVGHPFWIKTVAGTTAANAYSNGVTGNGVAVGTITFAVPTDAPNTLFYSCQNHGPMTGTLNIEESPQHGWWRFEASGTNVLDLSGWALHAVLENGLNSGPDDGVSGYSTDVPGALVVDGNVTNVNVSSLRLPRTFGRVRVLDPARFAITNTQSRFTVEAFIKVTSPKWPMRIVDARNAALPEPPPRTLISPHLSGFSPAPLLAMSVHSDATTNYVTTLASSSPDPSPVALGHWHHIAFVQAGSTSRYYSDYQLIGDLTDFAHIPGTFTNISQITLGRIAGDNGNNFEGLIDEIRITADAIAPTQFLRVAGGLAPGIRAFPSAASPAVLTVVTESNSAYRIQGSTNLTAMPQVWTNVGGVFTGRAFYTTVTNADAPATFYRVRRNP
jgi:hypothetical protein